MAAVNREVVEEWGDNYAEQHCRQDGPYCIWSNGARCRQQGKFQVTCFVGASYENEATEEYWDCLRTIRYTAEKRAWRLHRKFIHHTQFLTPWHCEPHHTRPQW